LFGKKHSSITHIQTGAERDSGKPGEPYNQALQDMIDEEPQRDAARREVSDLASRGVSYSLEDVQDIYRKHGVEFGR